MSNVYVPLVPGGTVADTLAQDPAFTDTYGRFSLARFGRVPAWVGDSVTDGAGSSNALSYSFRAMVPKVIGYASVSGEGTNAGVPGDTSAAVLARMDAILAANPEFVHLQVGTNDASGGVTLAVFAANITAIRAKCDAAGVPMTAGLVPPRASGAGTTIRDAIRSYNLWLRMWAPRAGVPLADTYTALVDASTGYLAAANDSGDGTHPNNAGHLAMANAISTMLSTQLPVLPWPVSGAGEGLISDPLMAANPGGFSAGTHGVISLVAASNGDVPIGGWKRFTATNATGAVVTEGVGNYALTTGFSAGHLLLICAYLRASSESALNKLVVQNQSLTVRNVVLEGSPSATPGPLMRAITVQPGDTTLYLNLIGTIPANGSITYDIGAFDVFNLTTLGLGSTVF